MELLSPAGARAVTQSFHFFIWVDGEGCCPPQGRELLRMHGCAKIRVRWLLSPAGARVVTYVAAAVGSAQNVAVPRRGASCYGASFVRMEQETGLLSPAGARAVTSVVYRDECWRNVAVPRRGASCYQKISNSPLMISLLSPQGRELLREISGHQSESHWLLSPAGARAVTRRAVWIVRHLLVAVPRRGASCYSKNAKNTMRIFGIPTIFLYYLLYFCVSIRDIVGFLWCEPACNNLIYCYYSTRFAPNQPVSKP